MNLSPALFRNIAPDSLKFWRDNELDLKKVREFTELNNSDISRITGIAQSSVRFDGKVPGEILEHMANIANICNLVYGFFNSDVKTKLWLQTPNPMLGNTAPRDMIRVGRYPKLLKFVTQALEDGQTASGKAAKAKKRP